MGPLGWPELLGLGLLVVLLFGANRIPEIFRGFGQGLKAFKDEMKDKPKDPPNENSAGG